MRKNRHGHKIRNTLVTGFFVMILALMGTLPQAAQLMPEDTGADAAYAETTYTVFIYSGKEGYFGKPENTVKKITGLKYDEEVTVSLADLDLKVKDPNEYYVRGLKIAGHDNDELSAMKFQSYTFKIKEDTSFAVSYGMEGGMVKYTVNYHDKSGNALHESEEFYGMAGDKPVVAFRLIEGYLPDDYNLTKTLSKSEADNVFTFTYHRAEGVAGGESGEGEEGDNGGDGGNNGGNNGANANNGGNAAGNGTATANIGDNATPMANITDLDDNDTPTAPGPEKESGISGATLGLIGIIGAGILIALALLYFILRRRGDEEAEEEE